VIVDSPAPGKAVEPPAEEADPLEAVDHVVAVAAGGDRRRPETMIRRLSHSILIAAFCVAVHGQTGKTFSTPEEARDALIQAAASGMEAVKELFGPASGEILRTGDAVEDRNALARFNQLAAEKVQLEREDTNPKIITLSVGNVQWPFAVPLVQNNGRWYWDVQEGKAEIRRRTIGGNELDAIEICRGYVAAQKIYAEADRDGNGVLQYARKVISSEGKKDGLYWPGDDSPVAERFAKAFAEGYQFTEGAKSYHGYFYKVLLAQGPAAEGGAEDYLVHGLMIGGFALVAWPADYRVSGIMSFIVNQDGVVYQKDLGPKTSAIARAMTTFNPDPSWNTVPEEDQPEDLGPAR